ncbi:MBL fold metallo-hydrolase [Pseudoxanthomonas dokdonensis]|uniref:Beta-lactamase n=1 Tax=Pseudoxanthomonas dokdonensis TaxID=344882 RepID=A0A0R0CIC7_9GAMM|nr:MBL fold metallo-hydrolase [Pseudoxanthomonas dokdonensis]KRG69567.1 beta-lactamase [Pseudoxanthomonas dokdonensis]
MNHGIHIVDTAFQRDHFDAAYLIVENGRAAFIDCGTNHSQSNLLRALADAGCTPADVDWLILTHVHLDHAGGAGSLMRALPNARLLAHPRAAPHMIDPGKLIAGATAVYGEQEMQRSYGAIVPVEAQRVVVANDGDVVELAGRSLLCIDTPGHASHHQCIWDLRSRSWFTGDTFGLSYREMDGPQGAYILPTTTPVQFDPDALKASISRLLAREPEAMYLTHYGRVEQPSRLARDLFEQIDAMVALALQYEAHDNRHPRLVQALTDLYVRRARERQCPLDDNGIRALLAMDIELNAQGLEVWLQRRKR